MGKGSESGCEYRRKLYERQATRQGKVERALENDEGMLSRRSETWKGDSGQTKCVFMCPYTRVCLGV